MDSDALEKARNSLNISMTGCGFDIQRALYDIMEKMQILNGKLEEQHQFNSELELQLSSAKSSQITIQQCDQLQQQIQEQLLERVLALYEQMQSQNVGIGFDTVNNSTSPVGDSGQSDAEQPVECEQLESVQEHTEQCNAIDQQRESEDVDAEQGHQLDESPPQWESEAVDAEQGHQLEESPPQRKEQVGVNPERKGTNDSNDDGKPHARVVKAGKYSLDRRDALKHRKRKRIGDKPKTYSCKECKKSFSFKGNLTKHLMIHNGQKPHKCPSCDKSFSRKGHLTQHLMIHTGQKPHKCPSCDKSFNTKSVLSRHLMIHNGEKPFVCDVCDTSFRQKNTLTDHMNIHAGRKPHKCNVCKKSFRQKAHLSIHLKIHQN